LSAYHLKDGTKGDQRNALFDRVTSASTELLDPPQEPQSLERLEPGAGLAF
jgi:hypothetical protein